MAFEIKKYSEDFESLIILMDAEPISYFGRFKIRSGRPVQENVLFRITQKRYMLEEGYKVTLTPILEGYAEQHFYQTDFNRLVQDGIITVTKKLEE